MELQREPGQKFVRIILKYPGSEPHVLEIEREETDDFGNFWLYLFQGILGKYVETTYDALLPRGLRIFYNLEETKFHLPMNIRLGKDRDQFVLSGPIIIVGIKADELVGLTEEQVEQALKYLEGRSV